MNYPGSHKTGIMKNILSGLSLLMLASLAHAVSESRFVYGYSLEVDGDGAIYSLRLPEAVYHGLTRADRGDLRVFNSEGVAVPQHLARADQLSSKTPVDVKLPLFPLYTDTQNPDLTGENQVHIVTDDSGAIIDINYGRLSTSTTKRISAYLLDCSKLSSAPDALIVSWPTSETDFVINVEVAGSDDLRHWQPVIVRKVLSNLRYAGHTLVQRRIDLPLRQFKYLRLSWLDNKSLKLDGVEAQFPATYQSQDRQWSSFKITDHDRKTATYYFDTHSVLPVDRVNIDLPKPDMLVNVSLASSASDKGPWHVRYRGLLYDLLLQGQRLSSPSRVIAVTTDRYWRLQLHDTKKNVQGNPLLQLGWIPEKLYFIARGEAPFTLAYGSARAGPADTPLAQLLKMDNKQDPQQLIKPAQLGSPLELGNSDNLEPAGTGTDWKNLMLWLILILGGIVLVVLGLRLYKQLDQSGPDG